MLRLPQWETGKEHDGDSEISSLCSSKVSQEVAAQVTHLAKAHGCCLPAGNQQHNKHEVTDWVPRAKSQNLSTKSAALARNSILHICDEW